jgi:pyruvate,water dikinase
MNNEWNDSLTGNYLWNNTNFGEAVTEVMTPLTWSVLQFTLEDWVFLPGYSTVGIIGGYPYLNISIFATLFRSLGRSQGDLLEFMESTLYMQLPAKVEIPTINTSRWVLVSGLFMALQVQFRQFWGIRSLQTYLDENLGWFKRICERIDAVKDPSGLYPLWQREMKAHIKQGVWCVLGSATHSANFTMGLRQDLTGLVGPDQADRLIANLSAQDDLLMSLGPLSGMAQVASGALSREAYLEEYGHRGPHEFELSVPRPAEEPMWFDRELATIQESPIDIDAMLARQRAAFDLAWQEFTARFPDQTKSMCRRIDESAKQARNRERARSAYIRDRWAIRLFALRVGALTGLDQDIFFLRLDELLDVLNGGAVPADQIQERKEIYLQYKELPPYPSVIIGRFDPFIWAADLQRRTDIFDAGMTQGQMKKGNLTGSPGSAGQIEGKVRILNSPAEGGQLRPGEVLVAVQTDIAWTMIFPRAAAVITDVGAPLSHAAIVARELGIPAVVGCGDATTQLKTGDRVRVDGGRGTVTILNDG